MPRVCLKPTAFNLAARITFGTTIVQALPVSHSALNGTSCKSTCTEPPSSDVTGGVPTSTVQTILAESLRGNVKAVGSSTLRGLMTRASLSERAFSGTPSALRQPFWYVRASALASASQPTRCRSTGVSSARLPQLRPPPNRPCVSQAGSCLLASSSSVSLAPWNHPKAPVPSKDPTHCPQNGPLG